MTMAHKKPAREQAEIIDGKAIAKNLRQSIKRHVEVLISDHKIMPGLAVVLVGDDPASAIYVNNKEKAAKEAGMRSFVHRLPKNTSQDEVLKLIQQLNDDKKVNGILVQMPLPKQVREIMLHELSPGMVLATGIYSPHGLLLIGEGQQLSSGTISKIRSHDQATPINQRLLVYS